VVTAGSSATVDAEGFHSSSMFGVAGEVAVCASRVVVGSVEVGIFASRTVAGTPHGVGFRKMTL